MDIGGLMWVVVATVALVVMLVVGNNEVGREFWLGVEAGLGGCGSRVCG